MNVNKFNKVIVNAISDDDLKVFSISFIKALTNEKQFLFRTAASFTKVIGHISHQALLSKDQMIQRNNTSGGLIIVGSHVNKNRNKLNDLLTLEEVKTFEYINDL